VISTGPTTSAAPGYDWPRITHWKTASREDAHEQEVRHGREAVLRELSATQPVAREPQEVRRPAPAGIGHSAPDAEEDRDQRLQDEPEASG
jgi:hypothetical protein